MPLNFEAGWLSWLLLREKFALKMALLVDSQTQLSFNGYKPIRCEQKTHAFVDPQKNPAAKYLFWGVLIATKISAQLGVSSCAFYDFISLI